MCGLHGTQEWRLKPGQGEETSEAIGVPGAESKGTALPLLDQWGTNPGLWVWAPPWRWVPWNQENVLDTRLLLAGCKQDNAFFYVEIPLRKGTRKAKTIFTANYKFCRETIFKHESKTELESLS